jgi:hypothetical protein
MLLIAGGRTSAPSGANTISGVGTGSYIDSKLIWKKDFFSNSNLTRFGYLSAMPSLTYTTDYGEPVIYSGGSGWSFTPGSTSSQINDNNKLRGRFYAVGGAIDDTALFFGGGCSGTSNNGSVEYSFSTSEKIGFLDEARSASLWNYRDSSYVYGSAGCANDTSLVVACGQAMSSFKTNSFRISFSSFDENSFSDSTSFFPSSRSMFTGETGG